MNRPNATTEPVRLGGWAALGVGTILVAAILWSSGVEPRPIVGVIASMWLTSIGGLEWARRHVTPRD